MASGNDDASSGAASGGDPRPALDRWFERAFGDPDPSHLGTGWMSGVTSVFLGGLALGAVVVLWFPGLLSTERFRSLYPLPLLRRIIEITIVISFAAGAASLLLRRRKVLGLTGCGLSLLAALTGGGQVTIAPDPSRGDLTLGLDWFLLNLLLLALLFVPLERLFPQRPGQGTFRPEWTTDGIYFLVSHALVQALSFFILLPATTLGRIWHPEGLQAALRAQPFLAQFLEIVLVADLAQYAVHRAFHRVSLAVALPRDPPLEPRSRLAGRLPAAPRGRGGHARPRPRAACRSWASRKAHCTPISCSSRSTPSSSTRTCASGSPALEPFLVTPRFHHWHHAAHPEARDRNFAVHLPWLDRLFGSAHFPEGAWPTRYGLGDGDPVPTGYLGQLAYPFVSRVGD